MITFVFDMRKLRTIEMKRLSVEEYHEAEKTPLIVILDDVRSMHNVGSVFRTADAFRLEAVYLCGITGCPPHNEIHKTALGAEESVEWRHFDTALEAVEELKSRGVEVYSVEQAEHSHGCLEIPQFGTKHSMNVSVTAGIVIYHFMLNSIFKQAE